MAFARTKQKETVMHANLEGAGGWTPRREARTSYNEDHGVDGLGGRRVGCMGPILSWGGGP
jgi:hypothetical protein